MKFLKAAGAYYGEFVTTRFDTGAAADADSTPVATATKNGTDDAGFSLTVTKIDTGRYKITGTVPAYTAGDDVQISIAATVNSVAAKGVVDEFVVVTALPGIDLTALAEAVLLRDWESIVAAVPDFSLLNAARLIRNKHGPAAAGVLPVYEEDGVTVAYELDITTDAAAESVTSQTPHV